MFQNILIIKPSSLGDVVHSLPVLAKLRERYPEARISWLVGTQAAPLVEANPMLDAVFFFKRRAGGAVGTFMAQWELSKRLRRERFDCVVDLQGLFRSGFFARVTGSPRRIGLSDSREGARLFYTDVVDVGRGRHAVDRYLTVGDALDFPAGGAKFELVVAESARRSVEEMLAGLGRAKPYFAMSLGARWESKDWPEEHFAAAGRLFVERFGGTVFLLGAASTRESGARIAAKSGDNVLDMTGRTSLSELVAIVGNMDLVITPDTGIMHIADALGTPLVAIFGATDPARTGPYFQRDNVIVAAGVCPKAPCLDKTCAGMGTICMKSVTPEEVVGRAALILEEAT